MPRQVSISILLAFAVIILVQRLYLADAPLHGDICAYSVLGHEMSHGRLLYSDLWERKPPLLYITFAAAELITGYNRHEIFLLGLSTSLATLVLIYFAGKAGGRGPIAGVSAAGCWTLLNCDLNLAANQPDPETFINVCLTAAFVLLIQCPKQKRLATHLLIGAALAAATLYKHNTAIVCAAMLIGHLIIPQPGKPSQRLVDCLTAGGVMVSVWLAVTGYFTASGRLHAFVDVLFHQNAAYSGSFADNLHRSVHFTRIFPSFMIWAIVPASLIAVRAAFSFRSERDSLQTRSQWWLLLSWALGTWPTIALTGLLYPHYYQLWLPIGCIATGWAAADLLRLRTPPIIRYATLAVAFTFLIFRQGSEFLLTPQQWVQRQFPYFDLSRQNQLGIDLGRLLDPDEQFWELGEDNALYFFSCHSPPSGLLFIDPLIKGDETQIYWNRLLNDLNHSRPSLVVLSDNWTKFFNPDAPIFPWLRENYSRWETPLGWPHYQMWIRHGSQLEKRARLGTNNKTQFPS